MEMPVGLSVEMANIYKNFENEKELFESLKNRFNDFLNFFCAACDDERWLLHSTDFIPQALSFFNELLMQNKMSLDDSKIAAQSIRSNISYLKEKLPLNITCNVLDAEVPINSFLFQSSSLFFFQKIYKECFEKKKSFIALNFMFLEEFEVIQDFVYSGEAKNLWRHKPSELLQLLEITHKLGLEDLALSCEEHFIKSIDEETAFAALKVAHKNFYPTVKAESIKMINLNNYGIEITSEGSEKLSCELKDLSEASLNAFAKVSSYITELICGEQIIEDSQFLNVVNDCPKLTGIDLSKTRTFNDNLKSLPSSIRELILYSCPWIDNASLKLMIACCPNVDTLDLSGCSQLSAAAWGALLKLQNLKYLTLSRCSNLTDEELLLVLNSCKYLESLDISECKKLTERGFHHLAVCARKFLSLNLGRTNITDSSLSEITFRLQGLEVLDIVRCSFLSELGIEEALKGALSLKHLILTGCDVSDAFVGRQQNERPHIKIIF